MLRTYGALSIPSGRVLVSWKRGANGKATNLTLEWHELGGPPYHPGFKLAMELTSYAISCLTNLEARLISCSGRRRQLQNGVPDQGGVTCKGRTRRHRARPHTVPPG